MSTNSIAIRVENLSKRYRIGIKEERHATLAAAFSSWVKSPVSNYRRLRSLRHFEKENETDVIWALKDVNFEIQRGEVVGIIGRNGAGKSTLLKIISRITEPSSGRITIRGKISSLLEVGTGFHQDLTGRENVYLNGTILGMSKKDIDLKFDQIVTFAEVEKFIDTPVKFYSSGMKVRLAFSVAAHLEPDILIIDEVLAVGDIPFQKKCLGKMEDVSSQGRTVLFVSHNLNAVRQLCQKGIVLQDGMVQINSDADKAISFYHDMTSADRSGEVTPQMHRISDSVLFTGIRILDESFQSTPAPMNFSPVLFEIDFEITKRPIPSIILTLGVDTQEGFALTRISTEESLLKDSMLQFGKNTVTVAVELPFAADLYTIVLRADQAFPNNRILAQVKNAFAFELQDSTVSQWQLRTKGKHLVPVKGRWSVGSRSFQER